MSGSLGFPDALEDDELGIILAHNRDVEKEDAAMALELISRRDPERV